MPDGAAVDTNVLITALNRTLVAPSVVAYDTVLRTGQALGLAGHVHDAVIV